MENGRVHTCPHNDAWVTIYHNIRNIMQYSYCTFGRFMVCRMCRSLLFLSFRFVSFRFVSFHRVFSRTRHSKRWRAEPRLSTRPAPNCR